MIGDLQNARAAIAGATIHTPTLACEDLRDVAGGNVALKAECLQVTGSFKLRGALVKLAALGAGNGRSGGEGRGVSGVVTASAGNHARALAYAARLRGVSCEVFMPRDAPVSKVASLERLGARVHLQGDSLEEALGYAMECGERAAAVFVHPFDDEDVIAGQATMGLELAEDVPDLARVIVPVGGGGLASGVGTALRRVGVRAQLIGVQARACAPYARELCEDGSLPGSRAPLEVAATGATVADGIAVKRPGSITLPLLRELLDGLETVSEDEIADAMVFLAERSKLVAEGAGAVAVAVLMAGRLPTVAGTTVAIVSGGNVDSGLLAGLLLRHETEEGRRVRLLTRVPDRPGGLAELLALVARARANVVSVEHIREALHLQVRETGVALTLETRGHAHTREVVALLADAGYETTVESGV